MKSAMPLVVPLWDSLGAILGATLGVGAALARRRRPPGPAGEWPAGREEEGFPHVLLLGQGAQGDQLATALRAFARLAPAFHAPRLTILGVHPEAGPLAAVLIQLARELGLGERVEWPGRLGSTDREALWRQAHLVLQPGLSWRQPAALAEALGRGLPLVCAGGGGALPLVRHCDNALVVPAGDHRAMADALLALADDRQFAAGLAAQGRQTVAALDWLQLRELWLAGFGGRCLGKGRDKDA